MTDNIQFTSAPAADLEAFLHHKQYSKITVLADANTAALCYPIIKPALPAHDLIEVPPGEEHKNIATCELIWGRMTASQLDRHSAMIVVGGGVLGDMGGFCSATYKRGIDFILIPTTLLSQVDASVGGKLGVDFQHFKNHIGVFKTPALTLLHAGFLSTLPVEEKRSGFAEVIKHALISDANMWRQIQSHPMDKQPWDTLLHHSVNIKLGVVKTDPYERGLRKTLNAGHTIGHAVETYLLQEGRKILHGEAVAVGLICESFLAKERKMLTAEEFEEITRYLIATFGKVVLHEEDQDPIAALTSQDKKNRENRILCVLLDGIGNAKWDCEISSDEVKRALTFYRDA